eukprot:6206025-Pleurochrysis_carterae.AAC.2
MPDLASLSEVVTSSSVFPKHETMPIPVTTTLLPPCAPRHRLKLEAMAGVHGGLSETREPPRA